MDNITLDLQLEASQNRQSTWQFRFLIVLSISNIVQGILAGNKSGSFFIGFGVMALVGALYYQFLYKRRVVVFNQEGIAGRLSWRQEVNISWSEVTQLELRLYELLVHCRSGKVITMDLSNCTYCSVT